MAAAPARPDQPAPPAGQPPAAGFLAVLLALCALTYRLVEAPMQRRGKRLAGWLERRYGPDPLPEQPRPVTVGADAS